MEEWDFKKKHKNMLPIEYLWVIHSFMDTDTYDKLSEPAKDQYHKMYWELEYILGLNDKPCIRCGDKPPHGEYYCDACIRKEDHEEYVLVNQRMHEDKYHITDRVKVKEVAERLVKDKLKVIFGR